MLFVEVIEGEWVEEKCVRSIERFTCKGDAWVRIKTDTVSVAWDVPLSKITEEFVLWARRQGIRHL